MRILKPNHYIILRAIDSGVDTTPQMLPLFDDQYNPVVRVLEAIAELDIMGMIYAVDRKEDKPLVYKLTQKGKSLL